MELLDCGHAPTVTESPLTNGVARDSEDRTLCYECAADFDRAAIERGAIVHAYVSSDGKSVTTWAGIKLMTVTAHWKGSQTWNGFPVHYFNAVAPNGSRYYGRNGGYCGGPGMHIRLRPNV